MSSNNAWLVNNAGYVADSWLIQAIQVSYNIREETTYNREMLPLVKYAKAHEDWKCLLITYDEEGTEEGRPVVPMWKWLMEV